MLHLTSLPGNSGRAGQIQPLSQVRSFSAKSRGYLVISQGGERQVWAQTRPGNRFAALTIEAYPPIKQPNWRQVSLPPLFFERFRWSTHTVEFGHFQEHPKSSQMSRAVVLVTINEPGSARAAAAGS
jgi:hypothetical protein